MLSLILFICAASIGIAAKLYVPGILGLLLFIFTKVYILAVPLYYFWRNRRPFKITLPSRQELSAGIILGLVMFAVIVGVYWFFGQYWIDAANVRLKAEEVGITSLTIYMVGAVYYTLINSLVEEFSWRWFLYRQWELFFTGMVAVFLAALSFTLHHTIALIAYTGNFLVVLLGSLGVFIAGAIWCWCYLKYRSLWPGYISHILADLAIALVGWRILFG